MKNILLLSILTTLLLSFTVFAEENNPCLHNNTGFCGVPLKPANLQSLTLSYPVPTADAPADVRSLVRSAVNSKLDSKTLPCKICEEEIKCKIDITQVTIITGNNTYTGKGTASGNVYLRCSNHVENGTPSTRNVPFTIKFEDTDDDDCSSGHSHDWSDWSYHCELESPSQESYSIYNTDTVLRSFIKAKANDRVKDKSYKSKICNVCQKERKENYSHSADWLCGYYSPYYHIHSTETEMTPPVTNGKHLYCVRMDSSNCAGEFAVIPAWIQQTVKSIEVNNAEEYNSSGLELPALPDSEPAPDATYIARVYDQEKNNGVKLKAIANFGDWTANNVSWEYYPHSPYDNRPYIYRPDTNKSDEIEFRATSPGTYVVVARCNYGDDENLPAQAKAVTIVVLDAAITVNFPNPDDETLTCQPCNPSSKIFVINANTHGLNAKQKLKIEIKQPDDEELYEANLVVKLADGSKKSVPFPIKGSEGADLLDVNGSWSGELVVKPLVQAEEGEAVETYTVKASFEDATLSDLSDSLDCKVIWDECADGSCQTGSGGAGIRKGGRGKRENNSRSAITARPSSVYGNFTLGKNSSGKVSGSFGFSSENLSLTSLSDSFKVQTVNGTVCGKDANGRVIWTKNGKTASVIDYTDTSINGSNVLTQVRVRQFFTSDTSAGTAPSVPSSLVSDATFTLNVSGNTANGISVSNTTYNGTLSQTESWSFSRPEVLLSSWGLNYSGYDCWQENQSGTITVSGEKYVTSGGNTYRYSFNAVGTSTALAKVTSQIEQLFSWGYSTISETDGNKTTTYTYNSGEYEQLASVRNPDGSRTSYTYDNEGNIATETNVTGTLTKVTTYTRSAIDANNIRIVTVESKIDGTVVSKRSYQEIIGVSAESEDAPASYTLNSIQYNGTQTFTTATTYTKRTNLHGNKVYSVTKRTNVNGTETRYSYVISGDTEITTTENGVFNNDSLALGTRQASTVNRDGATLSTASFFVDSANNINVQTSSTINSNFDEFGRARTTTYLEGSTVTRTYGCCGVATETDRDGVTTTYAYDEFKRVSHTVRDGITTLYSYDALDNQTSVTIKGRNDGEITTSKTYNNGELATSTDALGNVTSYTQSYSTNGNNTTYTETVTNPDNSTQITTSVNGQQVGTSGTAVHDQSVTQGVNLQITTTPVAGNVNMTVKSYTDMLGRNFKTEYADGSYSMNYYNTKSQLIKSVTAGGVVTLYAYDNLGRQITQAIDMNRNGEIDSADLVTSTAYSYGTQNGKTVSISTQTRSQGANSAVISVKKQSIDGFENWQTNLNSLTTHTKLERLGNGNIRQTVTNPDGTKVVTNSTNGRVITVQQINSDGTNGNLITYNYDEFNRQTGTVETFGTATVNTSAATYDHNGNILTQTVNGQTTSFEYDVMGRQTKVTAPGGVITNTTYYPTGEVRRVDGATYPVEYTYNGLGKQATMTTFKDANTPQVTFWTYNARGEMVQKTYADGNKVIYTYNADGQLLTRTWARGIVTTYTYDSAGRATGYSYSDGVTPAVVITLDFLDRQSNINDAAGLRVFTYGSDHLQTGETIPYISGLTQTYGYDIFKRQNQLLLGNHYVVNYAYDVQGRPASIAFNGKTKNYSYVPGTSNLSGYNVIESGNAVMNTSYSYDVHKCLTGITANVNGITYTHGYTLNDKNQRTGITLTDGKSWNFSYDNIGQVTGAMLNNSGNLLSNYSYNYDQIGNRIQATKDNNITSYTSNIVNQYTQINTAVPTYDQDGNMLTNGEWSYTWNGENRMISAQTTTRKVEFAYDYMGRCFERKEYTAANSSWNLDKTIYIVYDEYKQIAEYVNGELHQQYVWDVAGLDTVAFMGKNNSTYIYWTDGNKNVLKLFDATGVQASYSYDPFGKVATSEGLLAADNPFRFSSEYHNDITGLVEYIYRKYDPVMGRWTNRDPIEEKGGLNLYLICRNNVQYYMDDIGQGVVKDTYDFLTDPKGFMLDFIADKNIFAKIIIESVRFSYEFHNLLLKELNSSNILSQLTVIDPQKKCRRKIMFQDYQKIEECLLRDIEDAGTEMIGACMCFLGYSIQKSTPTLKLVQILPGKIGKSFAKATWNKIVDKLFSKSKGIVVKRVKRKLPNRFRNKYLYTTVDDMYEIIADELAKTMKETYVNKAKF